MTTALASMIAAQPDVIASLAAPVPAADRLAGARRIWLIGTGTSLHAAELGASALETAGLDARPIAANRFTAVRPGDAAIVITHTGQTAHARRSRQIVLDAGLPLVSITGPDVDWPEAVRTPVAEQSETYTVSYTAALTVLAGLAHHLGAPGLDPSKIKSTAEAVRHVLTDPGIDAVPIPARAMAIVGPGDWSVTAREGALKIREAARLLCEGFDPDRLLHGAAVPYGSADTLLALAPTDDLTAGLTHAARVTGLGVYIFPATSADAGRSADSVARAGGGADAVAGDGADASARAGGGAGGGGDATARVGGDGDGRAGGDAGGDATARVGGDGDGRAGGGGGAVAGDGLLDQIPMTVRLQLLALRFARQRAQNADIAITGAWADHALWEAL
ncbi:SIS domain-containing protein [Actinoplanes sp. NPDC049596]|uniref:SIS domain-containing protein n=1 Tax=unclassified Actinoplanes TaxID=2626549 RepID=UPI00344554A6